MKEPPSIHVYLFIKIFSVKCNYEWKLKVMSSDSTNINKNEQALLSTQTIEHKINYCTSHTFFYINCIAIKILFPEFHSICLKGTIQWNDEEACFVLDQHAELDLYSASSLKQQSAGRHVTPLGHIILMWVCSLLFLLNAACLTEKQQIPV
jgi:hypothetical protein